MLQRKVPIQSLQAMKCVGNGELQRQPRYNDRNSPGVAGQRRVRCSSLWTCGKTDVRQPGYLVV